MSVVEASQQWRLRTFVSGLAEDAQDALRTHLRGVYQDVRRMSDGVVQYGGKHKHFNADLCRSIAQELPSTSLVSLAARYRLPPFDATSAYCDFLMQEPFDADFNFALFEAASENYVAVADVLDFALRLLQDDTDVINMFLEECWTPTQMLLYCAILHLALTAYRYVEDLDTKWNTIVYAKQERPAWVDTIAQVNAGLQRASAHKSPLPDPAGVEQFVSECLLENCSSLSALIQEDAETTKTLAKDFVDELAKVHIAPFELSEIPDLQLVGDKRYNNLTAFRRLSNYQLCDHLEINYENNMNVNKNDALVVDSEGEFFAGQFLSWEHKEGDPAQMSVSIKKGVRKQTRRVAASKVAKPTGPGVMCSAGTRVLVESFSLHAAQSGQPRFAWGVIGTFPIREYKYHYLVFFDDGSVRFVRPPNIRLCIAQPHDPESGRFSPVHVYRQMKGVRRDFIRRYFSLYPAWPLMNVNIDSKTAIHLTVVRDIASRKQPTVRAVVLDADRCLLLMRYIEHSSPEVTTCRTIKCREHEHVDEWYFAGDYQRIPALNNFVSIADNAMCVTDYPKHIQPYIRMLYPSHDNESKELGDETLLLDKFTLKKEKNTARKTGCPRRDMAFFNFFNNARNMRLDMADSPQAGLKPKKRNIRDKLIRDWLEFPDWSHLNKAPHEHCSSECLAQINACHLVTRPKYKNCSPMFRPFLYGFNRTAISLVSGRHSESVARRDAPDDIVFVYEAPCGRQLRNEPEVALYIHATKCELIAVDQFTFRAWERVNLVLRSDPDALLLHDYSYSREAVDLPIVNCVDTAGVPTMIYQNRRSIDTPLLDRQMEYVSCCSCTDDCIDSASCECQQLTATTHQRFDERLRDSAADNYVLRRLEGKIYTGIYECNSLCACRHNCINRVAQRDMQIPLQLFKTDKKGYGVRTLVDLPAGQYVSTYAGQMFTDVKADELVKSGQGNDVYFADVDLYDSVEGMKRPLNIPLVDDEGISLEERRGRKCKRRLYGWSHKKRGGLPAGEVDAVREPAPSLLKRLFKDESLFVVDAQERGNIGRFYNHSCDPNMQVQMVFTDTHDLRLPLIVFFTLCDVEAGTELCWNYGYEAGAVEGKAIVCNCGAATCVGRIL